MSVSDLSLRDLEYVLALAKHQHFGRAAEATAVSQPALSKQIKSIEQTLGLPLFERSKRQVLINQEALPIIEQAQVVVDAAQQLMQLAKHQGKVLSGPFKLGAIATSGPYLIPHLLIPIKKQYPELELIIQEGYTDPLLQDLKSGKLDAVIAALPLDEDPALSRLPLFFEPFLLVVNQAHPYASRKQVLPKDLELQEMLLLEEGNCLSDQTFAICPSRRRGEAHQYQGSSLETLSHMVAHGMGYSVVPVLAKTQDPILKKLLRYVPFKSQAVGRAMVLVSRKNYAFKGNMTALAGLIQAESKRVL